MCRKIKFRAWNIKDNKYIEVVEMDFHLESIIYNDYNCGFENFIIEQYTGIEDKYGTEICEGDVLLGEDNSKAKVIYDEEDAMFAIIYEEGIVSFGNLDISYYEVVGNIH